MKKILVIDDEKDFTFFVKKNLEFMGGYIVITTSSGDEGVGLAISDKPDLILLDILMPQVDGFEVLKRLKNNKETKSIPVVMLTAFDADDAKVKVANLSKEEYIVKPVEMKALKAKIDSLLSQKR